MGVEKAKLKPQGFILKKPGEKRRTFQIQPYSRNPDGKKLYLPSISNEALSTINAQLIKGEISQDDAELHIKKIIIPKLKHIMAIPEKLALETRISDHNMKVFKAFWNAEYRRKKLENHDTAAYEFKAALVYFEPLSLHSSHVDDIQDHWDKKLKGTRHKRYGGRINQLLKYLKRDVAISLDRADRLTPKAVTWTELEKILGFVSDETLKNLYRALFGTGMRMGEIFALESSDVRKNGTIFVSKQITTKLKFKPYTKNRVNHDTIVLPEALDALKAWLKVEDKIQYRKRCTHPLIDASKKAFPTDKTKWISPHKLRHSFVRHLLNKQVSLYQIKDLIGDTLKTTEETYAGWTISTESLDDVFNKIKKKSS